MNKTHLLAIALMGLVALAGQQSANAQNLDSMLSVLDTCLLHRDRYEALWAAQGKRLRQRALEARSPRVAMQAWQQLGDHEFVRHGQPALEATDQALRLARSLGDVATEAALVERKALLLGLCGLPWEGRSVLDSARTDPKLAPLMRSTVWTAYSDLYDYFYPYNLPAPLMDRNYAFLATIEDSVRRYVTDPATLALTLHYATHKKEDMIGALLKRLGHACAADKGMVATTISNKYFLMHDIRRRDYWLAAAAVYNVRAARHDNEALNRLAFRMAELGDRQRAVRYAAAGYADAVAYGSRSRLIEVAPAVADALASETRRADLAERRTLLALAGMVLLLLAATGLLARALRQKRRLRVDMDTLRTEAASAKRAVAEARAAAATGDEYVTRFLELGLDTILKFEQIRQLVLNKLQAGETDRLRQLMKDPALLDNFRQKSLSRFDIAFLRRYPHFVSEVNGLLRPEAAISLPDTEIMNNELRLLAFMRLGITDGAKIAAILGVSINTIYFYRTKLRGMAIDRRHFDERVCDGNGPSGDCASPEGPSGAS